MLDDFGLNDTMEWLCNDFSVLNGIPCNFESSCDEKKLTHEEKLDLYRICQEALKNVIQHAEAGRVVIRLE
jgi:signal transduction histidine kinase